MATLYGIDYFIDKLKDKFKIVVYKYAHYEEKYQDEKRNTSTHQCTV